MNNRPLISFILGCYNQEAFIREAVDGALSQTYSPLEIIISDDCSTDRTFEIARRTVANYKGHHLVRLNRNDANLGIGGNVNRMMNLCHGELVVVADGDDISLPARTETTHQVWEQSGRRATSICSSYTTISADGTVQGIGGRRGDPGDSRRLRPLEGSLLEFLSTRRPVVCGCSQAWSPSLFSYFGSLQSDLEDLVLSFRSLAIGQILYINEPLVKYRRHGANVSFFAGGDDTISFAHREHRLRWVDEQTVRAYDNMLADVEILHRQGSITSAKRDRLRTEGRRIRTIYAVERQMMDGSIFQKLRTLTSVAGRGNFKCALRFTPRLLPRAIYRSLYLFRSGIKSRFRTGGPYMAVKSNSV
jgi:glycosyltransferase involved in cell wall biosynthesis